MKPEYKDLRSCIYTDEIELNRFRQAMLKVVLATDIFDQELNALRKKRWNAAFANEAFSSPDDDVNVKATIVIEHLIQASDVSHTMQHWHIYQKWNERLFVEMYQAYKAGRMGKDPATFWYKGEIGFFDNYSESAGFSIKFSFRLFLNLAHSYNFQLSLSPRSSRTAMSLGCLVMNI